MCDGIFFFSMDDRGHFPLPQYLVAWTDFSSSGFASASEIGRLGLRSVAAGLKLDSSAVSV